MFIIGKELLRRAVSHCAREFPGEACGIFAGKKEKVVRIFEGANADKSPSTYLMDPRQQFSVMKEIRSSGLEMVGIYHSHVDSEAYPSRRDIEFAFYPEASYVIISLKDSPSVRSFKIEEKKITEEEVSIV